MQHRSRSAVYSRKGLVAATQPAAVEAGLRILRAGGNAADAAVGMAACLNVVEPASTGIGGDCFCLYYDAQKNQVYGLNGSGKSPGAMSLETLQNKYGTAIPEQSADSITVPGAAAGWVDTVQQFGSGTLTLQDILAPAIELARDGFHVHSVSSLLWQQCEQKLRLSRYGHELLMPDAKAPLPGTLFKMPHLSHVFSLLAKQGSKGFYEGSVAESIVKTVQEQGGVLTSQDLQNHTTQSIQPIFIEFQHLLVYECPPNGQGITALIALGIIQQLEKLALIPPIRSMQHNSAEYLHILIEALRMAFADTLHFVTDPDHTTMDYSLLLTEVYQHSIVNG